MDMAFNGRFALPYYGLILESCYLTAPQKKELLVDVPGADGEIDLMKLWGEPTYYSRTLTACFTVCHDVKWTLRRLVNDLDGKTVPIILPGLPDCYMTGTVHISAASVSSGSDILITAACDPWLYSSCEQVYRIPASESAVSMTLRNRGGKLVVPEITVTGSAAVITANGESVTMEPGTHLEPCFAIPGGCALGIAVQGGAVTIKFREARLL